MIGPNPRRPRLAPEIGNRVWERQDGETRKAYTTFRRYLEMDKRSIRALAKEDGRKTDRTYQTWCQKYRWVERSEAWDDYIIREWQEKQKEQALARIERQANHYQLMQYVGQQDLIALKERADREREAAQREGRPRKPQLKSAAEARQYIDVGIKGERMVYGEPTEVTETSAEVKQTTSVDMSSLSLEELRELHQINARERALKEKARRRGKTGAE